MLNNTAQSIFWRLCLSLAFFKIMGLATLSIDNTILRKKGPKILFVFTYSRWGNIYNSVLIVLIMGSNYLSIPLTYHSEYPNKSTLTTYIEIIQAILGTFVVCAILLSYCVYQTSMVMIGNHLMDFEHRMRQMEHTFVRKRAFPALIAIWLANIFLFAGLLISEYIAFHNGPFSWIADVLPTLFACCFLIQYFSIVTIIGADFIDVNRGITNLSRDSFREYRAESLHQARRVFVSGSTSKSLAQLRALYSDLCEISVEVAEFYSTPVLFGIFFLFATLVYNAYYLITPFVIDEGPLEYTVFVNTACWVTCCVYPILLLTVRITKVINEVRKVYAN
ncbi:hypothetical protein KM043_004314 [Ampulex compressa]|nr:hypothetical protein KM043_004314 [Ampulex compressa]